VRKQQVTLLFAELRGFTKVTEESMPDVSQALINTHLEVMLGCIDALEGTTERFAADGLMVVFGPPEAQANHALRALVCAMEMQRRHAEWMAQRKSDELPAPELGIGISTGTVIAGTISMSDDERYTVIGETATLAAGLCGAARGGQIFITPDGHSAAASRLRSWAGDTEVPRMSFESVGPHRFKNIANPVQVVSVKVKP
jgi:adenylate cyclase